MEWSAKLYRASRTRIRSPFEEIKTGGGQAISSPLWGSNCQKNVDNLVQVLNVQVLLPVLGVGQLHDQSVSYKTIPWISI